MENTKIEWATHTFNPWEGCAKVSPGCKNCYADAQHSLHHSSLKQQQGTCWGINAPRMGKSADNWKKPLKWNREAEAAGIRARVFCASMADVFEGQSAGSRLFIGQTAEVPTGNGKTRTVTFVDVAEERLRLLRLIYDTPHLDWLLLTKRPENIMPALKAALDWKLPKGEHRHTAQDFHSMAGMFDMLRQWVDGTPPANVWLGTSVENQEQADIRVPQLLATPAAVRFLSCEPLLGPVDLSNIKTADIAQLLGDDWTRLKMDREKFRGWAGRFDLTSGKVWPVEPIGGDWLGGANRIEWVIVGGESGVKARPMHPDWVRTLRTQCDQAYVAFFFKQWGQWENVQNCPAPEEHLTHDWLSCTKLFPDGTQALYGRRDEEGYVFIDKVGKHQAGRLLDGREHNDLPFTLE